MYSFEKLVGSLIFNINKIINKEMLFIIQSSSIKNIYKENQLNLLKFYQ
jgi:hypothetical protein